MSTRYSNRTRVLSHTQSAEGQEASETFIPRHWHSDCSWRLTFRSSNPQHTDASQDQPYCPGAVILRNNVEYGNKMCQELLPLLDAECFVDKITEEEQSCQSGAFQLKAFSVLFPSYEPVLYLNSESTTLREATRL